MTPRLWILCEDPGWSELRTHDGTGRVLNGVEIGEAIAAFNRSLPGDGPWSERYPATFPAPQVAFDERRLPDWNVVQNLPFASARLQRAMALPGTAAELLPISDESPASAAAAQGYAYIHVTAFARAIDPLASDCEVHLHLSAKTGHAYLELLGLAGIRFHPGVEPPADLFRDATDPTILLATDALAQRVIDAGCTGLQFRHPLWFAPGYDHVVRTADGAAKVVSHARTRGCTLEPITLEEADAGPG